MVFFLNLNLIKILEKYPVLIWNISGNFSMERIIFTDHYEKHQYLFIWGASFSNCCYRKGGILFLIIHVPLYISKKNALVAWLFVTDLISILNIHSSKRDYFLFLDEIPGVKTLLRFYFLFLFFIVTMSDSELTVYSVSSESDLSTDEGKKY